MSSVNNLTLAIFFFISYAHSLKILAIFPVPTYSHYSPGLLLMNNLVDRGHNVTMLAPIADASSKFRTILLTGVAENFKAKIKRFQMEPTWWMAIPKRARNAEVFSEEILSHPSTVELVSSNETYDVVVVESFFSDAFLGFCYRFSATCVKYSASSAVYTTHGIVGNPDNPSYIPQYSMQREGGAHFLNRLENTAIYLLQYLSLNYNELPNQAKIMKRFFPNGPDLLQTYTDIDVVLTNSIPGITDTRPQAPNIVEIGGFHLKAVQRLPKELQTYLDEANDGAIIFSLGSVTFAKDVLNMDLFLKSFSMLKLKVLWKFEEDVEHKIDNVRFVKWLPQRDVLAHRNVKVFLTQSGIFSTIEALYAGVPTISFPLFGDQFLNSNRVVALGTGLRLNVFDLTAEELVEALEEILNNVKYRERAKNISLILNDQLTDPLQKAVHWIEFAAKHKDLTYLRSDILKLSWYQYLLLDVIAFVLVLLLVALAVLKLACITMYRWLRKRCCRIKIKRN